MTCSACRAALSALTDGEDAAGLGAAERHPADCATCRDWRRAAERLARLAQDAPGPSAHWSQSLLGRLLGEEPPTGRA